MAQVIPINFQQATSPFNINFDFTDYLETTGYVELYGMTDTAGNYILTRQQIESSSVSSQVAADPNAAVTLEVNFDYEFLAPQLVKGKLFVVSTIASDGSGVSVCTAKVTFRPYHYDGVTETALAAAQDTDNVVNPASTAQTESVDTIAFDVNQYFKFGDKLRIEAILKFVGSSNTADIVKLYHDGANRNLTLVDDKTAIAADSNLKIIVPFKIDS